MQKQPKLRFQSNNLCEKSWQSYKIEDLIEYEQPTNYIVNSENYKTYGTPVLTANKSFIIGFTDENFGIYSKDEAIIFDDFTCDCKYVNFAFKIKSSAIKILTVKDRTTTSLRCFYEALRHKNFIPEGHNRHWISLIQEQDIQLPCIEEQQKIAEFFTALDEKIRIHEQKLTKLISAKDSILCKLFKQEIRLKDKDGSDFHPWIKVKIGDILKVKHGKDYKHLSPGKIPVMATSGAISYVDTALCTWPCALIGRKGTIDKPQFMDKPFWCIDTLFYTKALGNNSPLFQYYLFQTIDWKKFNEGTGLPSLSASTIESIQCSIPMEKEQQAIANFLWIYDEKIKICSKKIEALKQLKKAFMQRMFV